MKKENRKMAQERRAAERKRQMRIQLIRNTLIVVAIVAFFGGMIIYGVLDSKKNADNEEAATTETTEQDTATTEESDTGSDLITDESLTVADGDTVNIDYVGRVDGIAFDGGSGNYDLVIGSHSFIDDFEEQLIGHHVGESVDVTVSFPEDYNRGSYTDANGESHSLNGAEAVFEVQINGIYE